MSCEVVELFQHWNLPFTFQISYSVNWKKGVELKNAHFQVRYDIPSKYHQVNAVTVYWDFVCRSEEDLRIQFEMISVKLFRYRYETKLQSLHFSSSWELCNTSTARLGHKSKFSPDEEQEVADVLRTAKLFPGTTPTEFRNLVYYFAN